MVKSLTTPTKYEVITETLLREIRQSYNIGDSFYTQRDLMKRFSASYATIRRVLEELKDRKIISCHVGRGISINKLPTAAALKKVRIIIFRHPPTQALTAYSSITEAYQQAVIETQEKLQCEVLFFKRSQDIAGMMSQIKKNKADGVLFFEDGLFELIEQCAKEKIPYVVVHPTRGKYESCVDIDDAPGLKDAVKTLLKRGKQKILVTGFALQMHNLYKIDACKRGVISGGGNENNLIVHELFNRHDILTQVEKLGKVFRDNRNIDAAIVLDVRSLEIVESIIKRRHGSNAQNISVVCFGRYDVSLFDQLSLEYIDVPHAEAASLGLKMLCQLCMNNNISPRIHLLKTNFSASLQF